MHLMECKKNQPVCSTSMLWSGEENKNPMNTICIAQKKLSGEPNLWVFGKSKTTWPDGYEFPPQRPMKFRQVCDGFMKFRPIVPYVPWFFSVEWGSQKTSMAWGPQIQIVFFSPTWICGAQFPRNVGDFWGFIRKLGKLLMTHDGFFISSSLTVGFLRFSSALWRSCIEIQCFLLIFIDEGSW